MSFKSDKQRKAVMAILRRIQRRGGTTKKHMLLFHLTPERNVQNILKRGISAKGEAAGRRPGSRKKPFHAAFLGSLSTMDDVEQYLHDSGFDVDEETGQPLKLRTLAVAIKPDRALRKHTAALIKWRKSVPGFQVDTTERSKKKQSFSTMLVERDMREFASPKRIPAEQITPLSSKDLKKLSGLLGRDARRRRERAKRAELMWEMDLEKQFNRYRARNKASLSRR